MVDWKEPRQGLVSSLAYRYASLLLEHENLKKDRVSRAETSPEATPKDKISADRAMCSVNPVRVKAVNNGASFTSSKIYNSHYHVAPLTYMYILCFRSHF